MSERQTKLKSAVELLATNKEKTFDEVCAILEKELPVSAKRSRDYYRYMVIKNMVTAEDGSPLPRIWLKGPSEERAPRTPRVASGQFMDEIVERVTAKIGPLLEQNFERFNQQLAASAHADTAKQQGKQGQGKHQGHRAA